MKNERASRANDAYAVLDRFNAVSVNYSRVSESTYEKSTVFPGAPCRHVLQSPPTRRIWRDTRVPRRCAQSPRASMRRSILPSFFSVRVSRGARGWMVHVVQLTSLARVASMCPRCSRLHLPACDQCQRQHQQLHQYRSEDRATWTKAISFIDIIFFGLLMQ